MSRRSESPAACNARARRDERKAAELRAQAATFRASIAARPDHPAVGDWAALAEQNDVWAESFDSTAARHRADAKRARHFAAR